MPRTISCEQCKTLLNLPDHIGTGKRLKCPKCAHRFIITPKDASSESTHPADADAALTSTYEFPKSSPPLDDLPLPRAEGDLREVLDLPLLAGDAEKSVSSSVGDAAALFKEEPKRKSKPVGAEARAQARRCSRCGGVIPRGMSLCQGCGFDQDTGAFVGLDEDLYPPPPPAPTGIPLYITIPGVACGVAGLLLAVLSLAQSVRGEESVYQYGWLMLAVVAGYGVYGAVQFILGKSVKVLLLALTLGAIVNVIALIGMPIFEANFIDEAEVVTRPAVGLQQPDDPTWFEMADSEYKPLVDRLDQQRITLGATLLIGYAIFSVYLNSALVRRYFNRRSLNS